MTLQDRINDYATRHQDELLRLLTTCTELPSPTGKEGPKARWILKELRTIGMDTAYIDDVSNVIVPYHIQEDVLAPAYGAHIDTVFLSRSSILTSKATSSLPHRVATTAPM